MNILKQKLNNKRKSSANFPNWQRFKSSFKVISRARVRPTFGKHFRCEPSTEKSI